MERQNRVLGKRKESDEGEEEEDETTMASLSQDLVETVLSWVPTSSLSRVASVCKTWNSIVASSSFRLASSLIPSRDPWFLVFSPSSPHPHRCIAFDTNQMSWITTPSSFLLLKHMTPVAASAGLICFYHHLMPHFVISNPLNNASPPRLLPTPLILNQQPLQAISMTTTNSSSYNLILLFGQLPHLTAKLYNSAAHVWEQEFTLQHRHFNNNSTNEDDTSIYFLSKAGHVVTTNMQTSPSKQYSSVITITKNGQVVYFLTSSGTVVACNLSAKTFTEYPRILPLFCDYSIDIVECRGQMLAIVLWEFLETASLRVWTLVEQQQQCWHQVAAMPPSMSHDLYGNKADINCSASGHHILISINSSSSSSSASRYTNNILYDFQANQWTQLPLCFVNNKPYYFTSTFAFEPRIETTV